MDFVREILLELIELTLRHLLRIISLHAFAVSAFVLACRQLSILRPWRTAEVTIPGAVAFPVRSAIEQTVFAQGNAFNPLTHLHQHVKAVRRRY